MRDDEEAADLDVETVRPATAGGDDRVAALFAALHPYLRAVTTRLVGDAGDAEDVVQEAFARLPGDPVLDRPDDEVRAWLTRVCLNLGSNRLRSRRRGLDRLQRVGRLEAPRAPHDDPLDDVLREEERTAVRSALAGLPERQRACLLLRHSGYSYAEIAATLDVAVGSVGVLLARAERRFRRRYRR